MRCNEPRPKGNIESGNSVQKDLPQSRYKPTSRHVVVEVLHDHHDDLHELNSWCACFTIHAFHDHSTWHLPHTFSLHVSPFPLTNTQKSASHQAENADNTNSHLFCRHYQPHTSRSVRQGSIHAASRRSSLPRSGRRSLPKLQARCSSVESAAACRSPHQKSVFRRGVTAGS